MTEPEYSNRDAALVGQVLAGDVNAFEELVCRWQGPVVDLAYRFCRERGLAEEIAQDTFLKAFRSLGQWRQESRFSTWLFAIAINMSRSRLRRWQPDWRSLDEADAVANNERPDQAYAVSEEARRVRLAVLALPRKYREAIILYYFHDMDVEEAAATLDVPVGTLKARLHRGRGMLRKRMQASPAFAYKLGVA